MLTTVASIMQGLHWRLMTLLNKHHTSSLTYQPCRKRLNHGKKPCTARFSILDDEKTLQPCGNMSSSRLKVTIRTKHNQEKHCIISWWLMLSPPCGPSAMNLKNCLLFALKSGHRNCYCVLPNVFCIVGTTEILIMIDIVCEVSNSPETPSNLNL